jgi:hypothetical protein
MFNKSLGIVGFLAASGLFRGRFIVFGGDGEGLYKSPGLQILSENPWILQSQIVLKI